MGSFGTIDVNGKPVRAYETDTNGKQPGVLVLHPWWGLNEDVLAYADRLASEGFAVLAPDLFDGQVATTVDGAEKLATSADENTVDSTVLAAADALAARLGPDAPLAALGFSFGAAWALWTPTKRHSFLATVVYYGTMGGPALQQSSVPVLGHFAEDDPYEPAEGVTAFELTLQSAGREAEIDRYPGTGHWFAEPSRDAYRPDAAELAFGRTVAFLRRHLVRR